MIFLKGFHADVHDLIKLESYYYILEVFSVMKCGGIYFIYSNLFDGPPRKILGTENLMVNSICHNVNIK